MLYIAQTRLRKSGLDDRVTLLSGDACSLPFSDGVFDGIISVFCFRNIADRKKALSEALRLLSSGGRLVLLELTVIEKKWLHPFYRLYSRFLIPFAGWIAGDRQAYEYLTDRINIRFFAER